MKTPPVRLLLLVLFLVVASSPVIDEAVAATGVGSPADAPEMEARLAWPLNPEPEVVRGFTRPAGPYAPGHRGVDLAAQPDQEVLAADAGVVVFAGLLSGRGVVSIDHDGGLRTTYEPVLPAVVAGDQVFQGQLVATAALGHSGCSRACLHWGVRRGGEYLNPLALVAERTRVRLKSWDDQPPIQMD